MKIKLHNFWKEKVFNVIPTIAINFNNKALGISWLCFAITFELR